MRLLSQVSASSSLLAVQQKPQRHMPASGLVVCRCSRPQALPRADTGSSWRMQAGLTQVSRVQLAVYDPSWLEMPLTVMPCHCPAATLYKLGSAQRLFTGHTCRLWDIGSRGHDAQTLCCILPAGPADDPDQLELQQQALEAAAAELHAAQSIPRYWTDYLQVRPGDLRMPVQQQLKPLLRRQLCFGQDPPCCGIWPLTNERACFTPRGTCMYAQPHPPAAVGHINSGACRPVLQVDLADSCVLTLSGAWQGQLGWDGWGVPGSSSSSAVRELVDAAVDKVRWWAEQCDRMQGGLGPHTASHPA